jgi:hypothetical protein
MMQLARRATLLVAFYLLASAATAYAECSWVMWIRGWGDQRREYTRQEAHASQTACRDASHEWARGMPLAHKEGSQVALDRTGAAVYTAGNRDAFIIECWPDTVDPRGTKGK